MNFRYLLLFAALGLSACNGSNSSQNADEGTFDKKNIVDTKDGGGETKDTGDTGGKFVELPTPEQIARLKAADLKALGKLDEAALALKGAGLDEEAYKLYAPEDFVLSDPTRYDDAETASLDPKGVDEKPAVKRHKMTLNGKTVWFTASTGHLVAYSANDKKDAQASIFYTAYTRDDLPREKRPVTFFFNGGPGAASIWLHLGGWGPKRIETNSPAVTADAAEKQPEDMPLVDNAESLLDESDLVFVDPPGTGYSEAIAPHTNKDFWGVQVDADVLFQYIKRYVNLNQRQSSPKYLYGESYGGGIRVPILSRLMTEAGTLAYDPDPSGKTPIALSGSIFHSPVFDMGSMCSIHVEQQCWTLFPTYAMTNEAYAATQWGKDKDLKSYLKDLRKFTNEQHYQAAFQSTNERGYPRWNNYAESDDGKAYLSQAETYTGVAAAEWKRAPAMPFMTIPAEEFAKLSADFFEDFPWIVRKSFVEAFKPEYRLNIYDSRMHIKGDATRRISPKPYDFDFYEHKAFHNVFTRYMPEYLNYTNGSYYQQLKLEGGINAKWVWKDGTTNRAMTTTIPDIIGALEADPSVKYLAVHGYYDTVTPFYTTEMNLARGGLKYRIPVNNYHGGHMIYYSNDARVALKKDVAAFYRAPPVFAASEASATAAPVASVKQRAAAAPALPLH
ncbi:S10 family serine carboxypeptidase-like protein [Phyllobacterium endophyticum]|uniref:Peptidase n=1 Tax=Phyllobacterium endophyticum TaxID=1149773 RepID=A0A2P7B042_9HYPH|nr:peptidase [Phyllobacterium endophyticum]MBB3235529.1 carboxypeptidase C (cathepsin A) [Phyllobacterium endophyticum]PSH59832.1 peptidase [Phyllobacterium endophyticum]TYR41982.1 peptidase [Phyllobacterium endophyticum]